MLTEELSGVKTTHTREWHARDVEVKSVKVLLISAQKKADDVEYEKYAAKARL